MYTLRTISSKGVESNTYLGNFYQVTENRGALEKEEFDKLLVRYYEYGMSLLELPAYKENPIVAFVENGEGSLYPIHQETQCYIMSESGKTFARIS